MHSIGKYFHQLKISCATALIALPLTLWPVARSAQRGNDQPAATHPAVVVPPQHSQIECWEDALKRSSKNTSFHPFLAEVELNPAFSLASPGPGFMAELRAHPVYSSASRISLGRSELMFRSRQPQQAGERHWRALCADIGLQQRQTLLTRGHLHATLVLRLLCSRKGYEIRDPLMCAKTIMSPATSSATAIKPRL
jgi:hypothetical protein